MLEQFTLALGLSEKEDEGEGEAAIAGGWYTCTMASSSSSLGERAEKGGGGEKKKGRSGSTEDSVRSATRGKLQRADSTVRSGTIVSASMLLALQQNLRLT